MSHNEDVVYRGLASVENINGKARADIEAEMPEGARIEVPKGYDDADIQNDALAKEELAGLLHWSEGSDTYPLRWMLHLKSVGTHYDLEGDKYLEKNTHFLEKLDTKFGMIADPAVIKGAYGDKEYLFPWIGLTASWSSLPDDHKEKDVMIPARGSVDTKNFREKVLNEFPEVLSVKDAETIRVSKDGTTLVQKSVVMAGINCAFCHTSQIKGVDQIIYGGPGMINIRGYFKDLYGSTLFTMLSEENMAEFLTSMKVPEAKKKAKDLVQGFLKKTKIDVPSPSVLGNLIPYLKTSAVTKLKKALYKNQAAYKEYLVELLKVTYPELASDVPDELDARMGLLAKLVASDPDLEVAGYHEGYAHSDAFTRLTNAMVRGEQEKVTGIVSTPPAWGIKYKALYHWNANTTSVGNRNIGQAHGLGAVVIDEDNLRPEGKHATSNLINLGRLERAHYRLKVPNWTELFAKSNLGGHANTGASIEELEKGCRTYYTSCASCHGESRRVGPKKDQQLILDPLIPHFKVKTDQHYSKNQAAEVVLSKSEKYKHRDRIIQFTETIRSQYKQRYTPRVGSSDSTVSSKEEFMSLVGEPDYRGKVVFRDTYIHSGDTSNHCAKLGISAEECYTDFTDGQEAGYPARSLAGVWSTAPYLHNGTVPNMMELLTRPDKRTMRFFLGSNEYDPKTLGYKSGQILDRNRLNNFGSLLERVRCKKQPTRCVRTGPFVQPGLRNTGHDYGTDLSPDEKQNLIHFLKILKPEAEYSWENPLYGVVEKGGVKSCRFY